MRHVFETMGTVASVKGPLDVMEEIEDIFDSYDSRYSLYRDDSELSRIARRELTLPDASPQMIETYTRALVWRERTDGLFSPHRPDGVLDLNGIVKAAAIEAAGAFLDSKQCFDWSINVGGDILTRSQRPLGIIDPHHRDQVLSSVTPRSGATALATSGSAERGDHIWRGGTIAPPDFAQVSVIADDIVTADILATAIIAGGLASLDGLCDRFPIDVLAVLRNGDLLATPRLRLLALA